MMLIVPLTLIAHINFVKVLNFDKVFIRTKNKNSVP